MRVLCVFSLFCLLLTLELLTNLSQAQQPLPENSARTKPIDAHANEVSSQDKDAMWFDQSFKIMTCDFDTTDSECIGNPISPLCALESEIAQTIYNDERLHNVAYGKMPGPIDNLEPIADCAIQMGYRIYAVKQYIRSIDFPDPDSNPYGIIEGDVAINIQLVTGCEDRKCPLPGVPDPSSDRSFLLRKGNYGWFVVPVAWETGLDVRGVDFTNWDDGFR